MVLLAIFDLNAIELLLSPVVPKYYWYPVDTKKPHFCFWDRNLAERLVFEPGLGPQARIPVFVRCLFS